MIVTPIHTDKIRIGSGPLWDILDHAFPVIQEKDIIVITSKIVSICEGRVVKVGDREKTDLIHEEAEWYLPPEKSKYDISLTITRSTLIPTAGIDESNGDGYYILWPSDPYKTAKDMREKLVAKFGLHDLGVLITDSKTTPSRYGTTGLAIGFSGFHALNNYIDTPDIFGKHLHVTKANVADGLAASAVLTMGEGDEQTPIARIEDADMVHFDAEAPSDKEQKDLLISLDLDMYAPLLLSAPWVKGKKS